MVDSRCDAVHHKPVCSEESMNLDERVRFIDHKGKQILLEDFSHINRDEDFSVVLRNAQRIIQSQPQKSVLVLVDLSDIHFSPKLIQEIIDVVKNDSLFVASTAVVGATDLQNAVIKAISTIVQRELVTFNSREEAMEWLVK